MPTTNFKISVKISGRDAFDHMAVKLRNFTPAFEEVLKRWLAHNNDKFEEGRGAELSGATFSGDTAWKPVTDAYSEAKRRMGFPNWLMVRTGELKGALTTRGAFGQYDEIAPMSARFSLTDEPRQKAQWNLQTRPVMFLDSADQIMIREMFEAYLNDRSPFVAYVPSDTVRMDAEMGAMMNPLGGA